MLLCLRDDMPSRLYQVIPPWLAYSHASNALDCVLSLSDTYTHTQTFKQASMPSYVVFFVLKPAPLTQQPSSKYLHTKRNCPLRQLFTYDVNQLHVR
jgi:hypothetical protein